LERTAEVGDSIVYRLAPASADRRAITRPFGTLTAGNAAITGQPFSVVAHLENPNDNRALARLTNDPTVRMTWTQLDGDTREEVSLPLPMPIGLPPGESISALIVAAPATPGRYQLRATVEEQMLADFEQIIEVRPAPDWATPPLIFESIAFTDAAPQPGDTLHVTIAWRVSAPLVADFSATVQLIDVNGQRVTGHDLFPLSDPAMPLTSGWQPGERVEINTTLAIPANVVPGDYRLLAALYTPLGDFPRVPVTLPEGSTATEGYSQPFTIQASE
jgi:hypothetical protein